jgi:Lecithin retinol acyltransferase
MNTVEQIIAANNLQPADVIVLKKQVFAMVDHFSVYLGRDQNTSLPVFAANYTQGTQYIWGQAVDKFLLGLQPERIERFVGTQEQRDHAVARALSKIGENNYNYFTNNCEHYKNFVQTGDPSSLQAEKFGNGVKFIAGAIVLGALLGQIFDAD